MSRDEAVDLLRKVPNPDAVVVLLLDIHERLEQTHTVKLVCGAHYYQHGLGWICSLPVGHEGDHSGQ